MLFFIGVILVIIFQFMVHPMDHARIRRYILQQGGKTISIRWTPFGAGWFWEETARMYKINYFDENGDEHEADCKTSMYTGVYFSNDTRYIVVPPPDQSAKNKSNSREMELELENKRLREELENKK